MATASKGNCYLCGAELVNIASLMAHHKIPVALSRFHIACRLVSKHASGVIVHPAFNTLYI